MACCSRVGRWTFWATLLAMALLTRGGEAQSQPRQLPADAVRIAGLQGTVEVSTDGIRWIGIGTNTSQKLLPGERVRTGPDSRAILHWSAQSSVPIGALTELEILPPHARDSLPGLHLFRGILSFFHRDPPGRIRFITPGAVAGADGTEFVLAVETVDGRERTTLSVIDGRVTFSNDLGRVTLTNGQQSLAEVGAPPSPPRGFIANNLLQWCLYYPAVIDPAELSLGPEERRILRDSLEAYRQGNVPAALARYPAGRQPGSDAERVYYAALLLSVGRVDAAQPVLEALAGNPSDERLQRLASALRTLIAAVKRESNPSVFEPQLASEWLAASYFEQSRAVPGRDAALRRALAFACRAVTDSPEFGFAWARVADLQFSFGRLEMAEEALDRSLVLCPRNAQSLALRGFLLAARNRMGEAIASFEEALKLDAALGNAWFGRGLCRIRRGDREGGREDLLVAAALEPLRAVPRSYLGKAEAETGDFPRADKELERAKQLDPGDPTAWLYSALLKQRENRINEAVRDLEKSQESNDNRSVYRSSLLLDQDRAVRSANLAGIYRDAGMVDWSVREASKAVSYDYANYSAHLFLANSFNELRDTSRANLRYETPTHAEYLLANLLAPAAAGTLSPSVSQQEYSKLFTHDGLGLASQTEYLSRGAWVESAVQYGVFGNSSYDLDVFYHHDRGERPNNDIDQKLYSFQLKQQLSIQDGVYLAGSVYDAKGGDLVQYYDPENANLGFRAEEKQEPIFLGAYHREWGPGVHSLLLAGWVDDDITVTNPVQQSLLLDRQNGSISIVVPVAFRQHYRSSLAMFFAEAQQIVSAGSHSFVAGARLQTGDFRTRDTQTLPPDDILFTFFTDPASKQDITTGFHRISLYAYDYWQPVDGLLLQAGLAYDHLSFPENFRAAPISSETTSKDQCSPKIGAVWMPASNTVVRASYTRSLSGVSLDQSLQLEPTQVAGFLQSYRSIIPESIGGTESGARFETYGLALEQRWRTGTYIGISGEILESSVNRTLGAFNFDPSQPAETASVHDSLAYKEMALRFSVDQLVGAGLSLGAVYQVSQADLDDTFPEVNPDAEVYGGFQRETHWQSLMHALELHAIYSHPSGFFTEAEALWHAQSNRGRTPEMGGADFWQYNAWVGYRLLQRRVELALGLLNVGGQDYKLSPLNLYHPLPRSRTLAVRVQLSF